jgi:hypothetical protein
MRPNYSIRLALAGLAFSVAACGGSTASTSISTATPAAPSPTAAASAAATPSPTGAESAVSSNGATDAYPLVAGFEGHFTGSWNNTTFGSTGSMTWDIVASPSDRTVLITVNVGGRFLGGSGAPPESIKLTHLGEGAIAGHSPTFGDVSGTITPDGALHIVLTNIPGGLVSRVDISGTFTGANAISLQYTVAFVAGGSNAAGTVTLARA